MAISPIGAGVPFAPPVQPAAPSAATGASKPADGFTDLVTKAVDSVEQQQDAADKLADKAATGDLTDVHDYMIASTKAQLSTELTVAVRNKALEAFNDIMKMPI